MLSVRDSRSQRKAPLIEWIIYIPVTSSRPALATDEVATSGGPLDGVLAAGTVLVVDGADAVSPEAVVIPVNGTCGARFETFLDRVERVERAGSG